MSAMCPTERDCQEACPMTAALLSVIVFFLLCTGGDEHED